MYLSTRPGSTKTKVKLLEKITNFLKLDFYTLFRNTDLNNNFLITEAWYALVFTTAM